MDKREIYLASPINMDDQIVVFVNKKPVTIYRGMQVKHALIAYDQSLYEACTRGEMSVEDEDGFRVGLEGAVHDGAKIYTRKTGSWVMGHGSRKKNHE
jgi:hypothetical protein